MKKRKALAILEVILLVGIGLGLFALIYNMYTKFKFKAIARCVLSDLQERNKWNEEEISGAIKDTFEKTCTKQKDYKANKDDFCRALDSVLDAEGVTRAPYDSICGEEEETE